MNMTIFAQKLYRKMNDNTVFFYRENYDEPADGKGYKAILI